MPMAPDRSTIARSTWPMGPPAIHRYGGGTGACRSGRTPRDAGDRIGIASRPTGMQPAGRRQTHRPSADRAPAGLSKGPRVRLYLERGWGWVSARWSAWAERSARGWRLKGLSEPDLALARSRPMSRFVADSARHRRQHSRGRQQRVRRRTASSGSSSTQHPRGQNGHHAASLHGRSGRDQPLLRIKNPGRLLGPGR